MAITNRALDPSEQRKNVDYTFGALATGVTGMVGVVAWPSVLERGQMVSVGVSGSPTAQLVVQRFIPGSGFTTWAVSSANAAVAFGTSGVPVSGLSLLAAGSTLLNLQANDVLSIATGGANSAVTGLFVGLVLRPIQDIKTNFGATS